MSKTFRSHRGFTLLETLLAITLFSIVITSSFGVFSMGIQIWKRSQGRSLVERKVVLALERMGQDVRNTLRVEQKGEGFGQDLLEYEGTASFFELPAIVKLTDKSGASTRQTGSVIYRLNPNGELCRAERSASDFYLQREPACRVLAAEVKKLHFEYLLYRTFTKSYSWYDAWEIKDGLPQAVRVNLEIEPKLKNEKKGLVKKYQRTFIIPVAEGIESGVSSPEAPVPV